MPNPKLETYKNKATGTVYDYTDAAAQAALADILDGTDIDSFGDVETALATKVDKVTGKGLSTNDYDNTAKGIVDNIQSNVIANTKLIKDTVGWSGKNKLQNFATNQTASGGGTVTVNADKSITLNGTFSERKDIWVEQNIASKLENGRYKLSGCTGGSASTYRLQAINTNSSVVKSNDTVPVEFSTSEFAGDLNIRLVIYSGAVFSTPVTIYPMITDADILDPTYEPYFGSTAFPRSEQAVLGAKNLANCVSSYELQSTSDSPFLGTVHLDKTMSVKTSWKQSKTITSATRNTFLLRSVSNHSLIYYSTTVTTPTLTEGLHQEVINDVPAGDYELGLWVASASETFTISEIMVLLSSDTDPTYAPYAMTNKELTEQLNAIFAESLNDGTTFNIPYKRKSNDRNTSGLIVMSGGLYHYFIRPSAQSNTVDVTKILDVNSSRSATATFADDVLTVTFNATVPGGITLLTGNKA